VFLPFKPTAGCQISTLIFEFCFVWQIYQGRQSSCPLPSIRKIKYQSWYLTPSWGLEVQKPTQSLQSVKGPGNTFDSIAKWSRTLPSLIYLPWDIYRDPSINKNQISKLIFDILLWAWGAETHPALLISNEKYIKDGKGLDHLGIKWTVLPGPLAELSAWVGFYTSSPQQDVKYQLWYLIFFYGGEVSINIPWKIY
jgi:hypothetical protein